MGGAAKKRYNEARYERSNASTSHASTSGISSSGKATQSVRSSHHSAATMQYDGSNPGSPSGSKSPTSPSGERNPANSRVIVENKNIDVGTAGREIWRGGNAPSGLAARPGPSSLGVACRVTLNTHEVSITELVPKKIYQYDVQIGSGTEKRGLIKKVWATKAVRNAIGEGFIYGNAQIPKACRSQDKC